MSFLTGRSVSCGWRRQTLFGALFLLAGNIAIVPALAQDEDTVEVAGVSDSLGCPVDLKGLEVRAGQLIGTGGELTETDGTLTVDVTRNDMGPEPRFIDFRSNLGIGAVVVAGADSILRFDFLPGATSASDLHAGANYQGLPQVVNSVTFCY